MWVLVGKGYEFDVLVLLQFFCGFVRLVEVYRFVCGVGQ